MLTNLVMLDWPLRLTCDTVEVMKRIITALTIALMLALAAVSGSFAAPPQPTKIVTRYEIRRETIPGPRRTLVRTKIVVKTVVKTVYVTVAPQPTPTNPSQSTPTSSQPVVQSGGAAACIRRLESGNDYFAQNPASSASGAYQFLDQTWQSVTGLSGRAKDYPPATQDAAFEKLWAGGAGRSQWVTGYLC